MKLKLNLITKSIMAGVLISIGGLALLVQSPLYFGFALLTICLGNLSLYTGKIGFVNKKNWKDLPIILLFNIIGVIISVYAFHSLACYETALTRAQEIVQLKLSVGLFDTFVSSIFCGLILFYACTVVNRCKGVEWFVWLAVTVFVLCGFNHVIADLFYFLMAGTIPFPHLIAILLGNSIGSILARLSE